MVKIVVIKIGSSVIFTRRGKLDEFRLSHLAGGISDLIQKGFGILLVVSGAVYCGYENMCQGKINISQENRQAFAGVGQAYLTAQLVNIFQKKNLKIAQILVTNNDLADRNKLISIKKTVEININTGIIPVFNENDVVELNGFGGNDLLAGRLSKIIKANSLWILSTWEGSTFGIGGKATKDEVIQKLNSQGIKTVILNGKIKNVLSKNIL